MGDRRSPQRFLPLLRTAATLTATCALVTNFVGSASAANTTTARQSTRRGVWSPSQQLAPCAVGPPQIAFPSSSPAAPSGPGAILWVTPQRECPGIGAAASAKASLGLRWLGAAERTTASASHPLPDRPAPALQAIGGSEGRVDAVLPAGGLVQVLQAQNGGRPRRVLALPSAGPVAITRGYLGDVAIAAVEPHEEIAVTIQRHYPSSFSRPMRIAIGPGAVTALAVTMDFRSDLLVAWEQDGAIYAHLLRASGRSEATQRVGPSAANPQLQAAVSDDNHGMVAWTSTEPSPSGATPRTILRLALSDVNVRFGVVRTVASFADPARLGQLAGTLAIVRLSGENVVLAWTERHDGRYRVLAAPAVFAATRPPTVVSAPAEQAVLGVMAAGPDDEAILLWRRLGADPTRWREGSLWAARANFAPGDRVVLRPAAEVTAEGSSQQPALGVNPGDDRALAAWLGRAGVQYAVASGNAGYRPHAYVPPVAGGSHPVAAGVAGLLLVIIAAGWFVHARRRRRPPSVRRWPF